MSDHAPFCSHAPSPGRLFRLQQRLNVAGVEDEVLKRLARFTPLVSSWCLTMSCCCMTG